MRIPLIGRKKTERTAWDAAAAEPVIRCSICTGEQVAGFRNRRTGAVEEVMLIRGEADLRRFREQYGISGEIEKIY